jgi:hypothetical protein
VPAILALAHFGTRTPAALSAEDTCRLRIDRHRHHLAIRLKQNYFVNPSTVLLQTRIEHAAGNLAAHLSKNVLERTNLSGLDGRARPVVVRRVRLRRCGRTGRCKQEQNTSDSPVHPRTVANLPEFHMNAGWAC